MRKSVAVVVLTAGLLAGVLAPHDAVSAQAGGGDPLPSAPTDLALSTDDILSISGGSGADEFAVQYRELDTPASWLPSIARASAGALAPAIVNGQTRVIQSHAYGVKLLAFVGGEVRGECGGVLIARRWVLTAAHCTEYFNGNRLETVDDIAVIYGIADVGAEIADPGRFLGFSDQIFVHPDFDTNLLLNDIALIRLEEEVNPGLADTVPIYEGPGPSDGDRAYVTGWGATATGGFTSEQLYGTRVTVDLSCGEWPEEDLVWDDSAYLCASDVPHGFCQGDSGGPLVVNHEGALSLVGLVSFNTVSGCGVSSALPDVYTRVSSYVDWVESHTGPLWTELTVAAGGVPTVELDGLQPGRRYAVQVRSRNATGVSEPTLETFTTDGVLIRGPADTGVDCTEQLSHPLTDVPNSSFAANAVGCIFHLGITTGTSPTTYSPANTVTREQMAAFIARFYEMAVGEVCAGSHPFADVPKTSFAFAAVGCIYELGITTGTSATTYSPRDVVTREQMAAFIGRLYRLISQQACGSVPPFTDVPSSSFAYMDVGCIHGLKVTTGTSSTSYSPKNAVTREQMAAFLARLYITHSSSADAS